MVNTPVDEWQLFRIFSTPEPAEAMRSWLEFEGVPSRVNSRSLEGGLVKEHEVLVLKALAHRARWIVGQAQMSEEELGFLATGKLPGEDK